MSSRNPLRSVLALSAMLFAAGAANAAVFINEIHYDNVGTDVGEAVEVVATAGEDLSQYRIVLYNGSNNTQYDDDAVPAGSLVSCGAQVRIGVINYPQDGLQNGAPDGLALVGPGNSVVQFLSYEGTMTAANGPAQGMTSVDIGVSEPNNTPIGHSLQLSGTGTGYADFTWQAAAANTFGTCNTGQSFGAAVDNPPRLDASTPANGATDFPSNGVIELVFSEPVDLIDPWFDLLCSVSGARQPADFAITGTNANYTLAPLTALTAGESCVLTLDASQILDRDGTADALVGPNTVSFSVVSPPPNQAPSVLNISPANGAQNVLPTTNITVQFSEPVTLAANAFTLSCSQTGNVDLIHANSGSNFVIELDSVLTAAETCTFTVHALAVSDDEGANLLDDLDEVISFTVRSSSTSAYYAEVNTSSMPQLRCSLNQVIRRNTVNRGYGWTDLEIADEDPLNPGRILDVYRNCSYNKVIDRVGNTTPGGGATCGPTSNVRYNREHVWPRSLGFNNTGLPAHNDLHMLHLSDEQFNAHRGNKPYANCPASSGCMEDRTIAYAGQGGGNGTYPGNSNWYTSADGENGSYEVWDKLKGNMARAVMYMAIRYEGGEGVPDLELTDQRNLIRGASPSAAKAYMGLLTTLLQWHAFDPPDQRERDRNDVVFGIQGNRNPFVDHPEWATRALFESVSPATCILAEPPLDNAIFADGFE